MIDSGAKRPRIEGDVTMEFDTVIRGGTIVDGTRLPRYRSDIGIKNGKIAKIGRLKSSDGAQVLDAEGLIVAPGAIDLHTHYDAPIHWDPYFASNSSLSTLAAINWAISPSTLGCRVRSYSSRIALRSDGSASFRLRS